MPLSEPITFPTSPTPEFAEAVPTPQLEPLSSRSPVTIYGLGAVRVGMTLEQAEQATGISITAGEDVVGNGCSFARPQGIENLLFMVQDGQIARVDVIPGGTIKTLSGVGIGNTEAEIEALYPGQIEVSPHEYVQDGHYLTYVPNHPSNSNYRIVFETDENGVVTEFRSGRLPEVNRVEGCF
ncbi:MAG: hypothetical protein F6K28_50960 [Microcoleus sp. SIO2G3]|nr:hypothetical protein [Microcoleus sp. SIO2G3]